MVLNSQRQQMPTSLSNQRTQNPWDLMRAQLVAQNVQQGNDQALLGMLLGKALRQGFDSWKGHYEDRGERNRNLQANPERQNSFNDELGNQMATEYIQGMLGDPELLAAKAIDYSPTDESTADFAFNNPYTKDWLLKIGGMIGR